MNLGGGRVLDAGALNHPVIEHGMPGLMAYLEEFGPAQPFKGLNINGSLHMTIQTGVLIEALQAFGATVRWASCDILSAQDHGAGDIAKVWTDAPSSLRIAQMRPL